MTVKLIEYGDEARRKLREGLRKLADVVGSTLGPRGRYVALEKKWGPPAVTRDGSAVAKEIEFEDRFENAGAQLLRDVAVKTGEAVGDGAATAVLLARTIFDESLKHLESGADPLAIKRGIDRAVAAAVGSFDKISRPVGGEQDLIAVATVAAGGNRAIGKLIAGVMRDVGKDGAVAVEEGRAVETGVEMVEGMQFDRGYASPHFVNRPEKLQCVLDDALVLITEKKIQSAQDLIPVLEIAARLKRPIVIVAEEFESEALALLVVNRLRNVLECCAVKAPGFGDQRKEQLEDIATRTGGRAILTELGMELEKIQAADLGRAKSLVIEKEQTTVLEGGGDAKAVGGRIAEARAALEKATSDYDKEKIQKRLGRLAGKVAKITVGGATEVELKERKSSVEDALAATRAALEDGVIPGGGVAFVRACAAVDALKLEGDERLGALAVRRGLEEPLRRLATNGGFDAAPIIAKVAASKDPGFGYNVEKAEFMDLVKAGILDSRKVARLALQNAASVAGLLLATEAIVTEKPGEDPMKPPG